MAVFCDKRDGIEYNSIEELTADIIKTSGGRSFTVGIPNDNIEGLDLEFRVERTKKLGWDEEKRLESEGVHRRELYIRLLDGEAYYIHYGGWLEVGEFDAPELAKKLIDIQLDLREKKYLLKLEVDHPRGGYIVGGCPPYYRIKTFAVDGIEIARK